jgi:hypothetical protein
MLGDIILAVKQAFKEFFCIHNYTTHYVHPVGRSYEKCTKCGRIR